MPESNIGPFEVTEAEIKLLSSSQLVGLLDRLLSAECWDHGIPQRSVQGTFEVINDGGEDYRVEWDGGPAQTAFIPNRFTIFQCKAEKLTTSTIAKVPREGPSGLNVAVEEVIRRGGSYIVFTSKTNVTTPDKKKPATGKSATKQSSLVEMLRQSILTRAPDATITIDLYGPPRIRAWVNHFPAVALWVKRQLGTVVADFAFLSADDWQSYRDLNVTTYVPYETAKSQMANIQETLAERRSVVRLIGHSGLGKSRLAFEALRQHESHTLTSLVIYARRFAPEILSQVRTLVGSACRGIVVVDECPPSSHRSLSEEVRRTDSGLSLLTLDHSFARPDQEDHLISLDHAPDDVIKQIIAEFVPSGTPDVDAAAEFCAGYPQIAVLVGRAMQAGVQHFADFVDREAVVQKLVWGHEPVDDNKWYVLRTAAIFSAVGIHEPKEDQLNWVASKLLSMTPDEFLFRLEPFKRQRVVQEQGYSINVVPRPIAAQLAAEFWINLTPKQREAIRSADMPDELKEALCERLADLNYLNNARVVASQLCGPQGPFGSAEAINTEVGAHCLRELSAVAPEEVIEAIERCFGHWSEEKLKAELGPGRRWIVWTLDALSWDVSTFESSIRFMFRLAVAENETWGNNATNEFAQRFRIQLPGTEASLDLRAQVLECLVQESQPQQLPVILEALKTLLDTRTAARMAGSERQGSRRPYSDYRPTWQEVWTYLNRGLMMFRTLLQRHPERIGILQKEFGSVVTGILVAPETLEQFETTLLALNTNGGLRSGVLGSLGHVLKYELAEADAEQVEPVRLLYERLLPRTLADRVLFYVKEVDWHYVDPDGTEDGDFERPTHRAEELGREVALDLPTFVSVLESLSQGDVKHAFSFGKGLISAALKPQEFINLAIAELKRQGESGNPSLVAGAISGLASRELGAAQDLIKWTMTDPVLGGYSPYFAAMALSSEIVSLLADHVRSGALDPKKLSVLAGGRVLEPVPPTIVRGLIHALKERGFEGAVVALDLLAMYVHGRQPVLITMIDVARDVLSVPELLDGDRLNTMAEHHFEVLSAAILATPTFGAAFADYLSDQLVKVPKKREYRSDRLRTALSAQLIEKFPDAFLSKLAAAIEHGPSSTSWRLEHLLGSRFGRRGDRADLFMSLGSEALVALCREYPEKFSLYVARLIPLFTADQGRREWTEVARKFLAEFGDRKAIVSELSANLHTGAWSGPTSEHLRGFIAPLQELLAHPVHEVRRWARREISSLEQRIAGELRDEEEWRLRRG